MCPIRNIVMTIGSLLVKKAGGDQGVVEPRTGRNVLPLSTNRKFDDGFQVRHEVRNISDRQGVHSLAVVSDKTFPDMS